MQTRTTVFVVLTLSAAAAWASPCGLACWEAQADRARIAGDTRAEETSLRHALTEAETSGPRFMVAMVSNQLAMTLEKQRRFSEAEEAYSRSVRILDNGQAASAPELARTLTNLGSAWYQEGRFDKAADALSRAVSAWEKIGATEEPDFASALDNLGVVLRSQARYGEAEALFRRAIAIRENEGASGEREYAMALHNLSVLDLDAARYDEAEQNGRRALEIRRRVTGANSPEVRGSLNLLGLVAEARGANSDAAALFNQALDIPGDGMTTSQTLINLGGALRRLGRSAETQAAFRKAANLISETDPRHPLLATVLNSLGLMAHDAGNDREARQLIEHALSIWRESVGTDHPDYASGLTNLALLYRRKPERARELYLEALRIDEEKLGPLHPRVETDLSNLGVAAFDIGDDTEAEKYLERSLEIHARRHAPDSTDEGLIVANLGAICVRENKFAEGVDTYRRAISILTNTARPDDPRVAAVLEAYSRLMRGAGSFAEAEQAEVRATGIRVRNTLRGE